MSDSPQTSDRTPDAATLDVAAPASATTVAEPTPAKTKRPARPRKSATLQKDSAQIDSETKDQKDQKAAKPRKARSTKATAASSASDLEVNPVAVEQQAEQPAEKPAKKPPRQTAAKKNTTPRKKPAKIAKDLPESPVATGTQPHAAPEDSLPKDLPEFLADAAPVAAPAMDAVSPSLPVADASPDKANNSETNAETTAAGQPEGEVREKSRRSRSRRGRRKSAAARAAALAAQADGNLAENAADAAPHAAGHEAHHESEGTTDPKTGPAASESNLASGSGLGTRPNARPNTWQAGQENSDDETDQLDDTDEDRDLDDTDGSDNAGQVGASGSATRKSKGKAAKTDNKETREAARPKSKMFVSVLPGEQVEVVIAAEGLVQEYYVEMLHQVKVKGNIYKGVIHNVDPNLQAAFVSYGAAKNGFLQIDEVHPEYYLTPHEQGKGHKYPLIQKVLKPGQEILVQVVKEPAGTKGAFLTSYLSLPGRFLVLTPGREQIGVSRKVDNEEERARLRDLLSGLNPGEGLGVIVRTVSRGATKTSLQRDLQQLKRLWKDVRKKGSSEPAPSLIYQELGLDTRAVRDYLTEDVSELWVDDEEMAAQLREIVNLLFPRRSDMVHVHKDVDTSLFERFSLKKQLDQVHSREVTLPSGGRLVFDHTEALMAIDINSGRAAGKNNFEDTAYKTNLEAAQMIPLQLRLRDIGGQVVIDFIEMRDRSHWREVEKAIRGGMKIDRARHDVGKISSFGLLEIVRQRLSSSAISVTTEPCPFCKGTGQRRNIEWQAQQAMREIRSLLRKNSENGGTVVYSNNVELVMYLLNHKRERLLEMERAAAVKLELRIALEETGKK
ncbi:MAG: Rne/Rng family ribonuclease [Deltaproteobacteria bacterium]|jgi:ribonuclease E|nr:Rne/Rng family ribonuclease [Deltaproteobacteria bacterium]